MVAALGPADGQEPRRLRVLSYNIHHGEGVDGRLDLERIAGVIRGVEPDLVALQEVDRNAERTRRVDQPKELARLTGLTVVFERNLAFQGGDYGNAVLSRLPIRRHRNHHLPCLDAGEQRGVLEVELDLGAEESLLLFATHLDHRRADRERVQSAEAIHKLIESRPATAAILAGDLNAAPDSEVLRIFRRSWHDTAAEPLPTVPVAQPARQIDYILFRPADRFKLLESRVLNEPQASDHRPILSILELLSAR
jgi:endonuclease/exonuclease/phosphatase family metal-dependent hydrolase